MAYKNAKITPAHVRLVVRKTWRMYDKLQMLRRFESQIPVEIPDIDRAYKLQRESAERAIAALPEWQRKEFVLP